MKKDNVVPLTYLQVVFYVKKIFLLQNQQKDQGCGSSQMPVKYAPGENLLSGPYLTSCKLMWMAELWHSIATFLANIIANCKGSLETRKQENRKGSLNPVLLCEHFN